MTRCAVSATTREIVRDQHDRGAELVLQIEDQIEDLRLDRHVERGGRLVGDQHPRVAGQRHRDHRALPHAARQLVRVFLGPLLRLGDLDEPQHLDGLVHRRGFRQILVQPDRLADLGADRHDRVQRGHRLLEDHRDLVAADVAHLGFAERHEILAVDLDRAADDASRRVRHQAQQRQRGHRLAAAGLADDRQGFRAAHRERDVVDRLDDPEPGEQVGPQSLDLDTVLGIVAGRPQPR